MNNLQQGKIAKNNNSQVSAAPRINLVDFLYLVCALWINGGVIRFSRAFNATIMVIVFAFAFIIMLIFFSRLKVKSYLKSGFFLGFLFFVLITIPYILKFNKIDNASYEILFGLVLLSIFLYLRTRPLKIQLLFVSLVMIDCIIINIRTLILLSVNFEISRLYAQGAQAVLDEGISIYLLGGYGYIYSLVIACIALIVKWKKLSSIPKWSKFIGLVFFVTSVFTVIKAEYTIALLMLILGVITAWITRHGLKIRSIFIMVICIITVSATAGLLLNLLIEYRVFGDMITNRLEQILALMNGTVSFGTTTAERFRLYLKTISYLPNCLIVGVHERTLNLQLFLGMHTEWLDRLAMYGLIRYAIFLVFFEEKCSTCSDT